MLTSDPLIKYINHKLSVLSVGVNNFGKLNLLDTHNMCEDFYQKLLNIVYRWDLENVNSSIQNVEAIDLIDKKNKIVIQVSSTVSKAKIDKSLKKPLICSPLLKDYTFKFLSISKDAKDLRKNKYASPSNIEFDPKKDIIDIHAILNKLKTLQAPHLNEIKRFLEQSLFDDNSHKIPSLITKIVEIIISEPIKGNSALSSTKSFKIERKIKENELSVTKYIIETYPQYQHLIANVFKQFHSQGKLNTSLVYYSKINNIYRELTNYNFEPDQLFYEISKRLEKHIVESQNFPIIEQETLEFVINIIMTDAFIECKIFKEPAVVA